MDARGCGRALLRPAAAPSGSAVAHAVPFAPGRHLGLQPRVGLGPLAGRTAVPAGDPAAVADDVRLGKVGSLVAVIVTIGARMVSIPEMSLIEPVFYVFICQRDAQRAQQHGCGRCQHQQCLQGFAHDGPPFPKILLLYARG